MLIRGREGGSCFSWAARKGEKADSISPISNCRKEKKAAIPGRHQQGEISDFMEGRWLPSRMKGGRARLKKNPAVEKRGGRSFPLRPGHGNDLN